VPSSLCCATISSGLYRFLAIAVLLDVETYLKSDHLLGADHTASAKSSKLCPHHMLRSLQQSKNAPSIAVQSPSISHLLGIVYAPDEKSAEAAAIAEFKIGEEQLLALARG
jgi:hypothetical protein